jgi:DNA-binding MarR family transcriptional regulator
MESMAVAAYDRRDSGHAPGQQMNPAPDLAGAPDYELIELLFFGYRDFVGEPDQALAAFNFGRAHHRVLHFVHRQPGLTIAALLDILKITKQSLARVLKDLIESGHVEQRAGADDRRQRLLFMTPQGSELAERLARAQTRRLARAIEAAGGREAVAQFLTYLVDAEHRPRVLGAIHRGRA